MANGYFPDKKATKLSSIVTPAHGPENADRGHVSHDARSTQPLRDLSPLGVGGTDLVEGAHRIMQTPAVHKAGDVKVSPPSSQVAPLKVARLYMWVGS